MKWGRRKNRPYKEQLKSKSIIDNPERSSIFKCMVTKENYKNGYLEQKRNYNELIKDGINSKLFKSMYPDKDKEIEANYGMSKKEIYEYEVDYAKNKMEGNKWLSDNYDRLVRKKVDAIDIQTTKYKHVKKLVDGILNDYINEATKN